jgi:hypothetical protein
VFNSGFSEGKSTIEDASSLTKREETLSRQLLKVADGFDLFHALLYYLYADMICFTEVGGTSDLPVLATEDVEGIFVIAD